MILPRGICEDIFHHAAESYPNECCGIAWSDRYERVENISSSPADSFLLKPEDARRIDHNKDVLAFVHSHPDGPEYPSKSDMQAGLDFGIGMVIVCPFGRDGKFERCAEPFGWGGKLPKAPLIGRPFRHGVTDCYSLIKDWYSEEMKIELPEFPRDWRWWINDEHLYKNLYSAAGFRPMTKGETIRPRRGDIFLACIPEHMTKESHKSRDVITHGAIYLGKDFVLHHLSDGNGYSQKKLSERYLASKFVNSTMFAGMVRYDPKDKS